MRNIWIKYDVWYCLKSINVYTTAAMEYLLGHPAAKVDENAFEQASGVGVIVSPEQIESGVNSARIYIDCYVITFCFPNILVVYF